MSSKLYNRFLKLCRSWPIDKSKKTRDFGVHLHRQLITWFPKGELTQIDNLNEIERQIASLERLNDNVYKRKFSDPAVDKFQPASQFTKEQIHKAMSSEYIKENEKIRSSGLAYGFKDLKISLDFLNKKKVEK